MSKKNPTARVQVAVAVWEAACPAGPVPGTQEIERRTIGRGTSVLVEGTAAGLGKLADRITRLKGIAKAERERVSERVLAAVSAIESGGADEAAQARERVAAKVAKLLEHARSAESLGNAEEAATFAAKVDELLVKFELGMSDLEYAAVLEADPLGRTVVNFTKHDAEELPNPQWKNAPTMASDQRRAWQETLCQAVASAYFCNMLCHPGSTDVSLVGRESHRQMAEYVMVCLVRDVLRQGEEGYWQEVYAVRRGEKDTSATRGYKAAFRNAYVKAVAKRLREQREADLAAARSEGQDGKALIRLDNVRTAVERYMAEHVPTAKAQGVRGQWSGNASGLSAGQRAGANASIRANGLGSAGGRGPALIGAGR